MSNPVSIVQIGDLIQTKNDKSKQLQSGEYLKYGVLPIVDQGAKHICGYTNDLSKSYDKGLPVVVFGDHTLHTKFIDFNFAIGADGTQVLGPKNKECDTKYLYYLVSRAAELIGSEGYKRHFKILKEFDIEYIEPLPEQQKIATILSSVDDVIEKTRAQIDKLKDLKIGMMQELLTKGIGHSEFKDSPVGRIPASWTVGLFEDLCVLQRGFDLPVQDRLKGDVPILGSNGIVGRHNEAKVLSPAVITGRSGSLGDVLFVLEDCWPLNTSLYIKDFKGNDEKFVFYFLQHFNLKKYGTGTGVPTLNRNDVHIVNVSFPCLVEQIKIAEALTVIDETIAKKACSIESKKSLKKALMQDLLTGKVRVKLTDKESAVV